MLENTFCHVPGVGETSEVRLWNAGVNSWESALELRDLPLTSVRSKRLRRHIRRSVVELEKRNHAFFSASLPSAQHWRMFPQFSNRVAYVDIETTGLSPAYEQITTIALFDGARIEHFVYDRNLDEFAEEIAQYDLLVTYNGKTFDVPFIRSYLGLPMDLAHIDLRYVLASLGFSGGLKRCERMFGLDREELADVDGFFAVLLWRDYERNGNERALDTLLAYNMLDVVNLAVLMAHAYNLKTAATPFAATHRLPVPTVPELGELPFQPDAATIERLKRG